MIWWLVPLALLAALAGWLYWEIRGNYKRVWPSAPDGPLTYRVNYNSTLARLIRLVMTGNTGTAIHAVVALLGTALCTADRIAPVDHAAYKAAHEIAGHLWRQRAIGGWTHLWRYVTSKAFRVEDERLADAAGLAHRTDPHFERYARERAL